MSDFLIRDMEREEAASIGRFPPPEWNFDAAAFFSFHFGRPYFYPIVAAVDGKPAGIANALLFGDSAWLGNIIVVPEHRREGLGGALTTKLVEHCRERGYSHQLLIATEMGRPMYEKLGFHRTGEYVFLKPGRTVSPPDMSRIRPAAARDLGPIAGLDMEATAEDRRPLLGRFLDDGYVHISALGNIDGFYLPSFAQGPVIADNEEAGLALLQLKHSLRESDACLPSGNHSGIEYLKSLGFAEDRRAPRLALGADVPWVQKSIYARGAGYCG